MKTFLRALALATAVALFAGGCGNSAQRKAYEDAVKLEQQLPPDRIEAAIAEYQKVIRLEPGTKWARQAQARLEAVQARVHAEKKKQELNESVFHQTGVD